MHRALVPLLLVAFSLVAGCGGGGASVTAPESFAGHLPDPFPPSETRTLRERDYSTAVPADWNARVQKGDGMRSHFLNSGSGHANDYGLAGPEQVGLTIANERTEDSSPAVAL